MRRYINLIYIVPGTEHLRVFHDLLDHETGGWNVGLVNRLFQAPEAVLILNMPTFDCDSEDKLMWWRIKNGSYSI